MSLTRPDCRRSLPVRLTDINLDARLRAARLAARTSTTDPGELLLAAIRPSDQVYYVEPAAAPILRQVAA